MPVTNLNSYISSNKKDIVGLKVKNEITLIGPSDYLNCWFSNVKKLEKKTLFGKRLPLITNDLYSGKLQIENINKAKKELQFIRKQFKKTPINKLIWDFNNEQKKVDFPKFIKTDCNSLYDLFINLDGQNLIETIDKSMDKALSRNWDLLISQMFQRPDKQLKADQDNKSIQQSV